MGSRFKQIAILNFFYWALILFIWSCAKPMSPSGGPKDETPPKIVRSIPPNGSTNFTGDEIIITLNEYVNLKDINNQLIISPPVREIPDFKLKGKSIIIKFKEPWREETTYNIFFGDAIQDITENNPITGYKFTFSTGNVLDSMMIEGKLINAFNLTPVKGAFVMLYDSVYDSVPYKQLPYYISRTNEGGEFTLTNLRNLPYRIFALSDINANYLFDQPNEEISFIDSLITPWGLPKNDSLRLNLSHQTYDTTVNDSVVLSLFGNDSIAITDTLPPLPVQDSLALRTDSTIIVDLGKKSIQMFHFREVDSVQNILKSSLLRHNVISIAYKLPVKEPQIRLLGSDYDKTPIIGKNRISDTLTVWFPEYAADSIEFEFMDGTSVLDTIEMSLKPREKPGKKPETNAVPKLTFTNNLIQGRIKPGNPLRLTFIDPLESYELDKVILIEDTIPVTGMKWMFADSIRTKVTFRYPWKQGIPYTLIIPDSILSSVFYHQNDSTGLRFMGTKEEETSMVTLAVDLPKNSPYIIQLMDPKEKLIEQYFISEDATLEFKFLQPGKYKIKAIDDRNGNGYWDTGKYLALRYPERVLYYSKELELRANWTLEETWQIPEPGK